MIARLSRLLLIWLLLLPLVGCGALTRLSDLGRPPAMTAITDPTVGHDYKPLSMPMPAPEQAPAQVASLWRPGSRAFFRDQRAAQVGDLLTVLVELTDNADFENNSTATRTGSEAMAIPNLFGMKGKIISSVTGAGSLATNSNNSNVATGSLKRNETMTLRLAGTITQVLPNGNLVVAARQEVRMNSELRVLQVSGIVRPQDIASDNTVTHDRMAEARISYGGRGQLTDLQTPRYGQQLMDIVLPF